MPDPLRFTNAALAEPMKTHTLVNLNPVNDLPTTVFLPAPNPNHRTILPPHSLPSPQVSIPATLLNATSFTYLAYTSPPRSFQQALYLTALLTTSSGIPWAWTFLRPTNGALAIRAKKLAGAGEWPDAPALTYALHLESARGLERRESTRGLVKRWKWINEVRTAVLVLGTVLGVAGMCVV